MIHDANSFQADVADWMLACFGEAISNDVIERNHRFLEESLELVQSLGCTASEAHQLVDYVFNRPVGVPLQETGGVMLTLAALCLAQKMDMNWCGKKELERVWTMVEKIRAKQAAKPKHSPLPQVEERFTIVYCQRINGEVSVIRVPLVYWPQWAKDAYEKMTEERSSHTEAMREAMQEFCNRVEAGEVRSKYTYTKFKQLLETK